MPVDLRWYEENLIVEADYIGPVSMEQLTAALEAGLTYLEEAPHKLHFIVDFRQLESLPVGQLTEIPVMKTFLQHPNLGWAAILGTHPTLAFWLKVFIKFFGLRYAVFSAIDEAEQFLREVDRIQESSD